MTPQKSFLLCTFLSIIIIIFLSINSTKTEPNCKLISGGGGVHLCDKLFANPNRSSSSSSSTIRIFSITSSPSSSGLLLLESDLIYEVNLALGQLLLLSPQKKFWFDHSLLFGRTDKLDGCQPVLLYNFELPKMSEKSSKKSPPSSVLHLYTEANEYKFWSGIKEPEVSPSRAHPDFSAAFFQNGSQTLGYLITSSLPSGTEKEEGQFNSLNIISDLELDDLGNVSFDASKNFNSSSSFYLQRTSNPFEVALVPVLEVQGENLDLQNSQKLALFRQLPAAFLQPHNNTLFLFDHFRRCVYIVEHFPVELKQLQRSAQPQILQRINIPYEHFFRCPFLEKEGQNFTFVENDRDRCDRNYIGSPDDDGHFDPLLWTLLWSFTVFTLSVAIILLCYCCCGVHSIEEEEDGNLVNLKGKGKTPKRARFFFGRWRTPGPSKLSPKTTSSKTPDTSSSSTATIMPTPRFEAKIKEEKKNLQKLKEAAPDHHRQCRRLERC
ncbi:hypothetical protein TYRP_019816 [Tyrophagus putrescentiae]|nr:hypothetical protein TYRP_019816 [Tyrophagus putrescentiae]